jgi:uncharacterized protein (DUF2267 family)
MRPRTVEVFTETIEKTGQWLNELMDETGKSEPRPAYSALRAVLHVLRDRLTVDEAVNLGAQLPMLVRGFYYDGWRPAGRPLKHRHKRAFLQLVADCYPALPETEREATVRAVFKLLARHISAGEIQHVRNQLSADMRALWETPP